MYRAFILLFAVVFIVKSLSGCTRQEEGASNQKEEITIAITLWPGSAPICVAYEKGYFKDEGLNLGLQPHLSGHLSMDAVLSGRADLATAGETPIAHAAIEGKPLAVIATVCEIDRAILIIARKDRGIASSDDLRGRRIGVVAGTTADFFLHIYLVTSYIHPEDVRIVSLATDEVVDSLLGGQVDAVSTWAPHTIVIREKLGSNALVLQEPNLYTMTWNIVATQDFVNKNSERIKRFLRAIVRANQFISEHPAEIRAVCSKHMGEDSLFPESEWVDYRFTVELDQSLILNLEDQARWMFKKEGAIDRTPPNFMHFIAAEGLKAVRPEAVRITGK